MMPLMIEDLSRIVGGSLVGRPPPAPVDAVCIDTRKMKGNALFVAIRGDNHDGHDYLPQAAAGGAIAALVERLPGQAPPGMCLLRVAHTRRAMGELARHVRRSFRGTVIAVGGSNGKTGTKRLIDAVLRTRLRGSSSPKSFNNDIGVPLTIFDADAAHDYVVLELGTNHPGEMAALTRIAEPDVAVITCIAEEHLEGFGDLRGVIREEASIVAGLRPDGLLVVNGDRPELLAALCAWRGRRITFGAGAHNDLCLAGASCTPEGVRFRPAGARPMFIPWLGRHVAINALAAVAVGRRMGLSDDDIAAGLAVAPQPEMRMQVQRFDGVTVINDAYNANPGSMEAALGTLADLPAHGRKIAVLGEMRELGSASDRCHRLVGAVAAATGLDILVCVGPETRAMAAAAVDAGMPASRVLLFDDAAGTAASLPAMLREGDMVLLKGSRALRMEAVAEALAGALAPARRAS